MTVVASQLGGMNRNDGRICGHADDTRCTLRGYMNRNMEVISECRGVEVTGYCCTPCWRMNRQYKCVNQKDEHDGPYEMNRNKLVESRNKRENESKRNVGVYCAKYDLHK